MEVRQYAYFGMSSLLVDPDAMSEAVGVAPDETQMIGSKRDWPQPIPRFHLWSVRSGLPDTIPLDGHFAALVTKLESHAARIRGFLANTDAGACLQVVRYFTPGPEDRQVLSDNIVEVPGMERLGGQHPLLGFKVDHSFIRLAADLGVEISFDEYGDEDE